MDKLVEKKEISLLDYLVLIVKHKKFLIGTTFIAMVIFYLTIFFSIEEQFDATATIVPSQDNSTLGGLAGMLGDIGGDLPFDIGGLSSNPEIGLYNTILFSRTTAEKFIEDFDLWQVYDLDKNDPKEVKAARERFWDNLGTEITEDGAFVISLRSPDPDLSADIANGLIEYMNNKIIDLKVKKSRNNRIFLEERLADVRGKLENSEDSLKAFQNSSGIIEPEEQFKGIISAYSGLEQQLFVKQVQKEILGEIYQKDSPQYRNISIELEHLKDRINKLKSDGVDESIFVPYEDMPGKAVDYFRYYREVEINGTILQFILPLYEQAKLEEQKKLPVLQIIDDAKPPEEKSFPPRTILTLLFGFTVFSILFMYLLIKQNKALTQSEQIDYIKKNLFKITK